MAASNSRRSLAIKTEDYHLHRYARGTREALIHHGITREGPFPGDPGERKTVCDTTDPQGRPIFIRRASKTTFSVFRDWTAEEKAAMGARLAREQAVERAHALVNSWPKSVASFRALEVNCADYYLGLLEGRLIDGENGGYRLSDDAARRLAELVDELIALIKTETIVMDQALRDKYTPSCILKAAKAAEGSALAQYGDNVVPFPLDPYRPPSLCLDSEALSLSLQ
ncbi:MAG: hypothetical protein ACYC0P_03760 [Thiobacillus sp.]